MSTAFCFTEVKHFIKVKFAGYELITKNIHLKNLLSDIEFFYNIHDRIVNPFSY